MKFNNDRQFVWRPDGVVIPFQCFAGLDYEATTANDIKSIGAGAANDTSVIEIGTSGVTGLKMTAAGNSVMPSSHSRARLIRSTAGLACTGLRAQRIHGRYD